MAIFLREPRSGETYDLRISEFSREASTAQVKGILSTVLDRAGQLAKTAVSKDDGKVFQDTLKKAADQISARAPEIAEAVTSRLGITADREAVPPAPEVAFKRYLKPGEGLLPASSFTADTPTREPSFGAPPPRRLELTPAVFAYLRQNGATDEKIAAHVAEWCDGTSFDNAPVPSKKWLDVLKKNNLDLSRLEAKLDINASDISDYLLGNKDTTLLQRRTGPLLEEAARDFSNASIEARTFYAMVWSSNIMADARMCRRNIDIAYAAVTTSAVRAALDKARTNLTELTDAAKPFADGFALFQPVFETALATVNTRVLQESNASFGVVTLRPGQLELGIGRLGKDGKREEVAPFKFQVKGIERFAIFVGPLVTACTWSCMDRIVETTTPTTSGEMGKRTLAVDTSSYDFGLGTGLHVTVRSWINWGLGGIIGYPLSAPAGSSKNVLTGLGLRHTSGIEVSAGVHWFEIGALKSEYADKLPVDLSLPGNQALTSDDATTPRVRAGIFLMFGFAPDIL